MERRPCRARVEFEFEFEFEFEGALTGASAGASILNGIAANAQARLDVAPDADARRPTCVAIGTIHVALPQIRGDVPAVKL
ncbi:hypothetical protein [Paraburkholderia phenoliruptrix]|uniref:hypothetical protein n=1 Tax=Paraburkholderia phenoliruptrix TaxID=252970 RepID=UPI0028699AF4|nr:hypothetical protein [Paraburkholderia phenoliruptrix]WMY06797.1 hypothetical protein P3F88_10860 [Paraburkholderia phenoliruptrix]